MITDIDERNATECPCGKPKEPGDAFCVTCDIAEDQRRSLMEEWMGEWE